MPPSSLSPTTPVPSTPPAGQTPRRSSGLARALEPIAWPKRPVWLAIAAIWSFFALAVAAQLYFSMRHHGHHWWRILLWQLAGAATWMVLSPLVFWLKRRFPLAGWLRPRSIVVHGSVAVAASLTRLVPMTALSRTLDPYRPVPLEPTFQEEYLAQLVQWLPMDLLIYGAVLTAAYALDYREQVHRDQLRAARLEAEWADAELRALKFELQPHFLFNTLNAVVGLVRGGASLRAEQMILAISELLRSTLGDRRQQLVPLADEVATTDLFLRIQRIRFEDRLDFGWVIEPAAEEAMVPSLLLQPLIENAVRHAVELGDGTGRIEVRIARVGERVMLRVEDDGPHRTEAKATVRTGIGLENVCSRLGALFGDRWSLDFEPLPERGAQVVVSFPWVTGNDLAVVSGGVG